MKDGDAQQGNAENHVLEWNVLNRHDTALWTLGAEPFGLPHFCSIFIGTANAVEIANDSRSQ